MDNVIITKGACDYRIFQHHGGYAAVTLEGVSVKNGGSKTWARVVNENDLTEIVSWTAADVTGSDNETEKFTVTLRIPAGGLYRIDTAVASSLTGIEWSAQGQKIYHVGVGDLFVITGQSNSAGYGRTPVNDPPEMGVHLCKNNEKWDIAAHPMNDPYETMHRDNFEPTSGHCPYLSFAKMFKRALGYPIGLIQESLGGSAMSQWNKREDGRLYNSMVESVRRITDGDMRVGGILWYQGCSDTSRNSADVYYQRFSEMVSDMRADFRTPLLPVYTVQLNKVLDNENIIWNEIREIERRAANEMSNVFVVPSLDLPLNDGIHNSSASNVIIGERLARAALEGWYGKPVYGIAPDIVLAEYSEKSLTLTFSNVRHALTTLSVPAKRCGFTVEDANGEVGLTGYSASENKIYITLSRELSQDAHVSFAKTSELKSAAPLDNGSGLPILAFNDFEIKNG